jgi:hypothetical protein
MSILVPRENMARTRAFWRAMKGSSAATSICAAFNREERGLAARNRLAVAETAKYI